MIFALAALVSPAHADVISLQELAARDTGSLSFGAVATETHREPDDAGVYVFSTEQAARLDGEYLLRTTLTCAFDAAAGEGDCELEQRTWTLEGRAVGYTVEPLLLEIVPTSGGALQVYYTPSPGLGLQEMSEFLAGHGWRSMAAAASVLQASAFGMGAALGIGGSLWQGQIDPVIWVVLPGSAQ